MKKTVYNVNVGDTIDEISSRHGVGRDVLMDRNNIRESNYIYVGQKHINETFSEKNAKSLLIDQVGDTRARDFALAQDGDFIAAHRCWLNDYIEQKIVLKVFACDPAAISGGRTIVEIAKVIKGREGEA